MQDGNYTPEYKAVDHQEASTNQIMIDEVKHLKKEKKKLDDKFKNGKSNGQQID